MSQSYKVVKIHEEGKNRVSRGVTIPKKYIEELQIADGSYIKVRVESGMIMMEKMQ
jgi:antitoxin component of MazEF toxin-antitoxin module